MIGKELLESFPSLVKFQHSSESFVKEIRDHLTAFAGRAGSPSETNYWRFSVHGGYLNDSVINALVNEIREHYMKTQNIDITFHVDREGDGMIMLTIPEIKGRIKN